MILYVGQHGVSPRMVTRPGVDAILSLGDQVLNGTYARLSSFRHAVNFTDRHRVVTMAAESLEAGPATIVLRSFNPDALGATVRINDDILQIGTVPYILDGIPIYDSRLDLPQGQPPSLAFHLALLRRITIQHGAPESLAFLLNPQAETAARESFARLYAERMTSALRSLRECLPHGRPILQLREAVGMMAGAGFGLTPSGDDFIAGMLLALHAHEQWTGLDHSFVRQSIFQAAHSRDLLSMHFLGLAWQGCFHAPLKDVVQALSTDDDQALESAARRALALGETSGADLMAGFLSALDICMGGQA